MLEFLINIKMPGYGTKFNAKLIKLFCFQNNKIILYYFGIVQFLLSYVYNNSPSKVPTLKTIIFFKNV